jgi:hypothetical protein
MRLPFARPGSDHSDQARAAATAAAQAVHSASGSGAAFRPGADLHSAAEQSRAALEPRAQHFHATLQSACK